MASTTIELEDQLAERYFALLHQPCDFRYRNRRPMECAWAPSGYCTNCGRPQPTLLPNQPGTIT